MIYFGSQTGTSEGFAKTIAENCKRFGFDSKVIDLEEFNYLDFVNRSVDKSKIIYVFVVATYGEGDPSDNALDFHSWLKNYEGEQVLNDVRYTVFGLGNKQYEHFNAMGQFVNAKLEEMGCIRIYKYGQGDDDGGKMENDFAAWTEDLYDELFRNQFSSSNTTNNEMKQELFIEFMFTSSQIQNVADDDRFDESTHPQPKQKN